MGRVQLRQAPTAKMAEAWYSHPQAKNRPINQVLRGKAAPSIATPSNMQREGFPSRVRR
jgi:hypothetical protein